VETETKHIIVKKQICTKTFMPKEKQKYNSICPFKIIHIIPCTKIVTSSIKVIIMQ